MPAAVASSTVATPAPIHSISWNNAIITPTMIPNAIPTTIPNTATNNHNSNHNDHNNCAHHIPSSCDNGTGGERLPPHNNNNNTSPTNRREQPPQVYHDSSYSWLRPVAETRNPPPQVYPMDGRRGRTVPLLVPEQEVASSSRPGNSSRPAEAESTSPRSVARREDEEQEQAAQVESTTWNDRRSNTIASSPPGRTMPAAVASSTMATLSDLLSFLDTKTSSRKTSAAFAGGNTPEGEVYIRADGKKVRRVKKVVKKDSSDSSLVQRTPSEKSLTQNGSKGADRSQGIKSTTSSSSLAPAYPGGQKSSLGNFLGSELSAPGSKKSREDDEQEQAVQVESTTWNDRRSNTIASSPPGRTMPAAVASSTMATLSDMLSFLDTKTSSRKTSAAFNTPEGEVYIRADGKKVRRVKKVVKKDSSDSSLVQRTPSEKSLTQNGSKGADRSRGIKSTISSSSLAPADPGGQKSNLGNFLGSGLSAPGSNFCGSATVAGDCKLSTSSQDEGEIFIRPDGKKVRRVRKVNRSSSGTPAQVTSTATNNHNSNYNYNSNHNHHNHHNYNNHNYCEHRNDRIHVGARVMVLTKGNKGGVLAKYTPTGLISVMFDDGTYGPGYKAENVVQVHVNNSMNCRIPVGARVRVVTKGNKRGVLAKYTPTGCISVIFDDGTYGPGYAAQNVVPV
ncbi:hypothetical protein ACA910_010975 [Epithemia clementina (nom. ined.)]